MISVSNLLNKSMNDCNVGEHDENRCLIWLSDPEKRLKSMKILTSWGNDSDQFIMINTFEITNSWCFIDFKRAIFKMSYIESQIRMPPAQIISHPSLYKIRISINKPVILINLECHSYELRVNDFIVEFVNNI